MKKVAILYSGEVRTLLESFNNQYYSISKNNKEYDIDIFAHLWCEDDEIKNTIVNTLSPVSITFEKQKRFKTSFFYPQVYGIIGPEASLSMFYGMSKVNLARARHERDNDFVYDVVIRVRSDLIFLEPLKNFAEYDFEKVYVPRPDIFLEKYAINDHFAIGSSFNMSKFLNIFNNIEILFAMGCTINPECILGFHAKNVCSLDIKEENSFNLRLNKIEV